MHHSADQFDDRQGGGFMFGLMAGAAIGAAVALLFAPRDGAQTRRDLSTSAQKLGEQWSRRSESMRHSVHQAADGARDLIERGRSAYRDASGKVRDAAEQGADELDRSVEQAADQAHRATRRAQSTV